MANLAFRTIPLSYIQRHFIYYMPTISTPFRGRKPSVNLNQFAPIPLAFVGKLADKFSKTSVTNVKRKFMVFDHVFDSQVLNHDGLVFTYQLSCQLMQKVLTAIRNCAVYLRYLLPLFMSIVRAFLLTGQRFLYLFKPRAQSLEVFGIGDFVPVTCSYQASDANVQTDIFISFRQWFNNCIYEQRDVETPTRIQLDRDGRRFASLWQLSTLADRQCLGTLSKPNRAILPLKSRLGKLCATAAMLFFEVRILLCVSRPKVSKCLLKMPQSLLQRYTANLVQKLQVLLLFPEGQHGRSVGITDSFLPFVPAFRPCRQRSVINQTSASHSSPQQGFLFGSGIKTVLEGFLPTSHYNILIVKLYTIGSCLFVAHTT